MSHHQRLYQDQRPYFADRLFYVRYWSALRGNTQVLLEVGCSVGHRMLYGNRVGVDVDREAVREASKRGWRVVEWDFRKTSRKPPAFLGFVFGGVECRHVIEHIRNPLRFLRNLNRVLAPGGRIVLETPNVRSVGFDFWHNYEHVSPFTKESLEAILLDAGFTDVKVEYARRGIWGGRKLSAFLPIALFLKIQDILPRDRHALIATGTRLS